MDTLNEMAKNPLELREIILNTKIPICLKNFLNDWKGFNTGLADWCATLDAYSKNKPYFERIDIENANEPQWERKRQLVQMSACEFLGIHSGEQQYWSGMNYKRKHELPRECTESVDFGIFGFPHSNDDYTFWLSSKGANTPCHYDAYGCNIVVQVFGRKSWLLLPPESNLTTTRIPYEESSIYCKENFYAPSAEDKLKLTQLRGQLYHCILEPNDVLIVPKHWWHFVEALEISLSVNAWIPLKADIDNQIEECISKYLIENFVKQKSNSIMEYIMNPNQLSDLTTDEDLFKLLELLIKEKLNYETGDVFSKSDTVKYDYQYLKLDEMKPLIDNNKFASEVQLMKDNDFEKFLNANGKRFNKLGVNLGDTTLSIIQETFINSLCSPRVVELVKQEILKRYHF